LTAAFAGLFALAILLLLGLVYQETDGFLRRRVDGILKAEAGALAKTTPDVILSVIREEAARDPLAEFSLFSARGERVAGHGALTPADLPVDAVPRGVLPPGGPPTRALAERLPWGEILVVQRDTRQLEELRQTILAALLWSGALIILLGVGLAIGLSLAPLRRVRATQKASLAIAAGDLGVRLPLDGSRDELDALAGIVNQMMDEIERLVTEARTVGDSVAHELRTPLMRLRATLDHVADDFDPEDPRRALMDRCIGEADGVLARFRGLLRIAAVERRRRRSAIAPISLSAVAAQAAELYAPLAAEKGIAFETDVDPDLAAAADAELMAELLFNLIDNALKFTPTGGRVRVRLFESPQGPILEVSDTGPGVKAHERDLVLKRFYRSPEAAGVPGHGLGLSLVAAVADLHDFDLSFEDAQPGARIRLVCRPRAQARGGWAQA
jgi:signal transduction histidine kinase